MAFRAPQSTRHLSLHSIPPIPESDQQLLYSPQLSSPGRPPSEQQQQQQQQQQQPLQQGQQQQHLETDEWVVFSPSTIGTATVTTTSDLGSVVSAPRILRHGNYGESEDEEEDDTDDDYMDGTETDSLQPFRELANDELPLSPVRLPTHDGLGTFPSSSSATVLRSLEESLRIVAMTGSTASDSDAKIERWRRQHSQALLDEIERVTRRKMSVASLRGAGGGSTKDVKVLLDEEAGFMAASTDEDHGDVFREEKRAKERQETEQETDTENPETIWRRITRRFIRDIMGIDDELLQVIFGEALPESSLPDPSTVPLRPTPAPTAAEDRLLNRLARELGVLVTHYTTHPASDGSAFSTINRSSEDLDGCENDDGIQTPQPRPSTTTTHSQTLATPSDAEMPHYNFMPTLHHSDAPQWGLEDDNEREEEKVRREYWEQELGVRVFFSFLKSRFSSTTPPPQQQHLHHHPGPMFQQHPLIRSPSELRSGSWGAAKTVSRSGSGRSARGFYWDVASSVGSGKGSCVGTGVWAAI